MDTLTNNALNEMYLWRATILRCLEYGDILTIEIKNSANGNVEKTLTATYDNTARSYHAVTVTLTDNPLLENLPLGILYVISRNDYVFDFKINAIYAYTQAVRIV